MAGGEIAQPLALGAAVLRVIANRCLPCASCVTSRLCGVVVPLQVALNAAETMGAGAAHMSTDAARQPRYAATFAVSHCLGQLVEQFDELPAGARETAVTVRVAGRVVSKRDASAKLVFYDVEGDGGVVLQIMSSLSRLTPLPDESDAALRERFVTLNRSVRVGDIVGTWRSCHPSLRRCRRRMPQRAHGVLCRRCRIPRKVQNRAAERHSHGAARGVGVVFGGHTVVALWPAQPRTLMM